MSYKRKSKAKSSAPFLLLEHPRCDEEGMPTGVRCYSSACNSLSMFAEILTIGVVVQISTIDIRIEESGTVIVLDLFGLDNAPHLLNTLCKLRLYVHFAG